MRLADGESIWTVVAIVRVGADQEDFVVRKDRSDDVLTIVRGDLGLCDQKLFMDEKIVVKQSPFSVRLLKSRRQAYVAPAEVLERLS